VKSSVSTIRVTVGTHDFTLGDFLHHGSPAASDYQPSDMAELLPANMIELHLPRLELAFTVNAWSLRLHLVDLFEKFSPCVPGCLVVSNPVLLVVASMLSTIGVVAIPTVTTNPLRSAPLFVKGGQSPSSFASSANLHAL
jgi:hypothetical protein